MVRFVVQNQQPRAKLEIRKLVFKDLRESLFRLVFDRLAVRRFPNDVAVERAFFVALQRARLEGVVIRDDDAGVDAVEPRLHAARHKVALRVIVGALEFAGMRFIHEQHAQAVFDGDAGRDNEKIIREARVMAIFLPVEIMVQQQRGHHDGLARAGRHFEGDARQMLLRLVADAPLRLRDSAQNVLPDVRFCGDFVQPNRRFNRLALREKEGQMPLRIAKPKIQKLQRYPRDVSIWLAAPRADLAAHQIHQLGIVILPEIVDLKRRRLRPLLNRNRGDRRREDSAPARRPVII